MTGFDALPNCGLNPLICWRPVSTLWHGNLAHVAARQNRTAPRGFGARYSALTASPADKPGQNHASAKGRCAIYLSRLDTVTALGRVCKAKSLRNRWKRNSIEGNCVQLGFPISDSRV